MKSRGARGVAAALTVAVLVLLGGCLTGRLERRDAKGESSSGPGVWPLSRANAANTGSTQRIGPLAPRLRWSSSGFKNAGGVSDIAPVLSSDGTLFCPC